ncbi:MAG: hypothetical protein FJ405_05345 [Verrucomicrobia bacterium]|nr:hypothetical protein [Verrucomicrobiota bacterium]
MKVKITTGVGKRGGYSLVELLFATAITVLMFFSGLSAITFSKVHHARDRERAIMSDFAVHYMENLRGLSFDNLVPGMPINPIFDGIRQNELLKTLTIRLPQSGVVTSINNTNYYSFCPDLAWLQARNPTLTVTLDNETVSGVVRRRQVTLELAWDAPLGRGARQQMRLDMVRHRDLEARE